MGELVVVAAGGEGGVVVVGHVSFAGRGEKRLAAQCWMRCVGSGDSGLGDCRWF